jgi:hypothetical protein
LDFSTTLLREKFVISDGRGEQAEGHPIIAVGNRMVVPLQSDNGQLRETFVIRAQTMHACIRMAAKIIQTFIRSGPIMARAESFKFEDAWDSIIEDHERTFNPDRWIAVYNNGKLIYEGGRHPTFLDMVEKCDGRNPGDYDQAIIMAEHSFETLGRQVTIAHEGHIGLVTTIKNHHGKCGLILRNPNRRTTFNYMADNKGGGIVSAAQCLNVAAAFLEGIQLAFQIGMANEKLRLGIIPRNSEEARKAESGRRRLGRLNAEIRTFENSLNVRYRPEKPEFAQIVSEAELFTRDSLSNAGAEREQA